MKITAAVTRKAGAPLEIETLDLEAPRAGEVRVRIVGAGVCHTDIVARDQLLPVPLPVVPPDEETAGPPEMAVTFAVPERLSAIRFTRTTPSFVFPCSGIFPRLVKNCTTVPSATGVPSVGSPSSTRS